MMGKKRHAQERTARSDRAISASRSPAPVIWSARARSRSSMTETTSLVVNAMARAKKSPCREKDWTYPVEGVSISEMEYWPGI